MHPTYVRLPLILTSRYQAFLLPIGFAAALFTSLFLSKDVFSKPMPSASPQEAATAARWVVVAKYLKHEDASRLKDEDAYFRGVKCQYLVERVLKPTAKSDLSAIASGKKIDVQYFVHDFTPCLFPQGWKLEDSEFPEPNSSWILFLTPLSQSGGKSVKNFSTYRGNYGRWPATAENLEKVSQLLGEK